MGYRQVYMSSKITIGDYVFKNRCHSVSVKSSWKSLSDTSIIKLPNLKRRIDNKKLEKVIAVGNPVKIELGYNDILNTEFTGYVSAIKPAIPLEIHCEDEMWQLKQKRVSVSWKSITLKDLLYYLVPTATIDCPDMTLSPVRFDNITVAKALQKIKEEYLLCAYFRDKQLFVGLPYSEKMPTVKYHFQKNAIMGNLEFKNESDVKLKIKAISQKPDNKKEEFEFGDDDGDSTTLHFYNLTKKELEVMAKQKYSEMKYSGYRGSFKAKGLPIIKHGMIADLMDDRYPERAGSFFVDECNLDYDSNGFNRTNVLGRLAHG